MATLELREELQAEIELMKEHSEQTERIRIQQVNVEEYRKEIKSYIDKHQKFVASIVKLEQVINTLRIDLKEAMVRHVRHAIWFYVSVYRLHNFCISYFVMMFKMQNF